jgi:hypothetical protein
MLRRYIVPSLLALTMVFGAATASSTEAASEPLSDQAADTMIIDQNGAEAAPTLGHPSDSSQKNGASCASTDVKEGEKSHPCDSACICCGLTGAEACCDKCWTCWYEGGG